MLGRFTFWGGIKRIAMLITFVLLVLIAWMYLGVNVPDGDWFVGGEYEQKLLYGYILIILSIYVKPTADIFAPFLILTFCSFIYKYSDRKTLRQFFVF